MTMAALLPGAQDRTNLVHSKMAAREIHFWGGAADRKLRGSFALLPNAHQYAAELPQDAAEALGRAGRRSGTHQAATGADAATLRPLGLCECGGAALTNFGVAVRLAMIGGAR